MRTSLSWRAHLNKERFMSKKIPYALLINDIHVSKDNIPEFTSNWNEALDVCNKHNINQIIVGGDLWLSRSAQTLSTILAVRSAVIKATRQDITVIIAEGNHDKVDQESLDGYSLVFSEYPGVEIIDDFAIYEMKDGNSFTDLFVMSYFPENGSFTDRFEEMANEIVEGRKSVLYIHQGIRGGLATPSDDELPANLFAKFDHVLVGHYHNRKLVPGTSIEYIGSSRQHNFGEDEEKGYTILYTDGSYEFVKNESNTRYKVVDIDFDNIDESFLQNLQKIKNDGRYKVKVRVKCQSKQATSIDKQKLSECGATKIELVTEQTQVRLAEGQDLSKKYDKNGIKQEYTNFCSDKAISNVELGLSYLDKINASCGN